MSASLAILFFAVVIIAAIAVFTVPRYRLQQALKAPFPEQWRTILKRNLPVYASLPDHFREQLERDIKQFLHEKHFSGSNGLAITDEIRVTIAANACLLLLNRNTRVYPGLRYLIIYPDSFQVTWENHDEHGVVSNEHQGMQGESWDNGRVILSWADVLRGNRDFADGSNVALHEFAHQLDGEDGAVNGAPNLGSATRYQQWATILSREFDTLQQAAWQQDKTLIDFYGATNPAEFFAVVTEHFFEQPLAMQEQHPALFDTLQGYYQVNPAEWQTSEAI